MTLTNQPYPEVHAWQDLVPFLTNGWATRGAAPCAFKTSGNDLTMSAAFWIGTERTIATGLPAVAAGTRIFAAFAQTATESRPLTVQLAGGELLIESSHWQWAQHLNALVIAGEVPR